MSRAFARVLVPGAVLLLVAVPAAVPAAASARVTISPLPGTPDANPRTQISILGVASSRIASVRVAGARSGLHTGRLRAYSGGSGASFLPAEALGAGERVAVRVRIKGRAAALTSSFTVARLGPIPPFLNLPQTQPDLLEDFLTRPDLIAPKLTVHVASPTRAAGDDAILLTPLPSPVIHPGNAVTISIAPVGPGGPMIVDPQGRLVWFRRLTMPNVAAALDAATYRGRPVLTWWQGPVTIQAFGQGEAVIADTSYRTVRKVRTGNGYKMDIHEFRLVDDGRRALATIYSPVLRHLPGTPAGKLSTVLDSIIQEIDVPTGLVVWEWHALGHIPLAQSYATPANSASYDAFHINSVAPEAGGRLLVSGRNTSALYSIDRATGRIAWTLGGKASTFRLGTGARFWFQHDARALRGDRVSLFDDEAGPPQKAPASRGLVLKLDRRKKTATVERSVTRTPDTSAQSEGSTQVFPDGRIFVGFGAEGAMSEFSASGKLLFDADMPPGDGSYRTVRAPWHATPITRPDVVATRGGAGQVRVAVSWNGATEVARWRVVSAAGVTLGAAARTGFESTFTVPAAPGTTLAVRALDADGRVLATSPSRKVP